MSQEQWDQMRENALRAIRGIIHQIDHPDSVFRRCHGDGTNLSVTFVVEGFKEITVSWSVLATDIDVLDVGKFLLGSRVKASANARCCCGKLATVTRATRAGDDGNCAVRFDDDDGDMEFPESELEEA